MKNTLKACTAAAALVAGALLSSCSQNMFETQAPASPSYVALEANTGRILFSENSNAKRPIGMLANLANAAVAMDWIQSQNVDMNRMVTVPQEATQWQHTNLLGLQAGDSISIRDALYATVLTDDSAAATTLAYACGSALGSSDPVSAFVTQMNRMAKSLTMYSTYFKGCHGAVVSQSSARDMALLSMYVANNPSLLAICSMHHATVHVNGTRAVQLTNGNRLLSDSVDGLKVASSKSAGSCIMATSRRSSVRRMNPTIGTQSVYAQRLVAVILGMPSSQERYNTAAKFLRDGWNAWEQWVTTYDLKDQTKFLTLPKH